MTTPIRGDEVRAIVERVRQRMGTPTDQATGTSPHPDSEPAAGGGVFSSVHEAVEAAYASFERIRGLGLERRRTIIDAVRASMREHARQMAELAYAETGLGRVEDKVRKNHLVTDRAPGPEDLEPQVWTGDRGLTITEFAPFGVIAAITPCTNPTATIINNTIAAVSAGNAVVFNAHPNAKAVSVRTVGWITEAIVAAGGPADLVTAVAEPTIASAQELMNHPRIRLLVVTGGPGVVEEARRTRKRAILAGPGNPPVVVDATADLDLAAREIIRGASFDNNLVCTDEKEVIAVAPVADELLRRLALSGARVVTPYELQRLERVVFAERGEPGRPWRVNPDLIGQDAGAILRAAGIDDRDDVRLAVAEVPREHPLVWTEQMMPVMPVVRVADTDEAIRLAIQAEHGFRHTASIFSRDVTTITRMARDIDVSIFVANAANLAGLGDGGEGYSSFSIASPTGEGMTRPRSFSRERRMTVAGGMRIV